MSIQESVLLPLAVDIEDLIRIVARNLVALPSAGLEVPERIRSNESTITRSWGAKGKPYNINTPNLVRIQGPLGPTSCALQPLLVSTECSAHRSTVPQQRSLLSSANSKSRNFNVALLAVGLSSRKLRVCGGLT